MPMDIDDKQVIDIGHSLFRPIQEDETIAEYRTAFAENMKSKDFIMAHEIRLGRGWDKWTPQEIVEFLAATPEKEICSIPLTLKWLNEYRFELLDFLTK